MTQTPEQIAVLKPCPFCRSGRAPGFGGYTQAYFSGGVELIEENRSPPSFYVWCGSCGSKGPPERTAAEAIAAWNTRADAAPTSKADEVEAVARAICDDAGCIWDDDPNTPARLEWSRAAKAAIAALAAARGKAEPVAWMYHYPGDIEYGWPRCEFRRRIQSYEGMSCIEEDAGMIETPLYAHPPADRVAQVVEWLLKRHPTQHNGILQKIREDIAAEIERGEPFNG